MPYIKHKDRVTLADFHLEDIGRNIANSGELNYVLTEVCRKYWLQYGPRYQIANDIVGALEGAKLEFYRRIVAPYEDAKIQKNGDVY